MHCSRLNHLSSAFCFTILAISLSVAVPANAQASSCNPADEATMRQLVKDFEVAVATHDAVKYAAMFTEDADWENAFGHHMNGRTEIEHAMVGVSQTMATAEETVTDVRVSCIRPDLAIVDIYATIEGQKGGKGLEIPTRYIRMTQLHEKRDGKWVIRAHRVTDLRGHNKVS